MSLAFLSELISILSSFYFSHMASPFTGPFNRLFPLPGIHWPLIFACLATYFIYFSSHLKSISMCRLSQDIKCYTKQNISIITILFRQILRIDDKRKSTDHTTQYNWNQKTYNNSNYVFSYCGNLSKWLRH